MRGPGIVIVALTFAIVVFCAVYLLQPPAPSYFPVERAWHLSEPGHGPAMGWYGRSGVALLAGAFAGAAGYAFARRRLAASGGVLKKRTVRLLTAIILVTLGATTACVIVEQKPWFSRPSCSIDDLSPPSLKPTATLPGDTST